MKMTYGMDAGDAYLSDGAAAFEKMQERQKKFEAKIAEAGEKHRPELRDALSAVKEFAKARFEYDLAKTSQGMTDADKRAAVAEWKPRFEAAKAACDAFPKETMKEARAVMAGEDMRPNYGGKVAAARATMAEMKGGRERIEAFQTIQRHGHLYPPAKTEPVTAEAENTPEPEPQAAPEPQPSASEPAPSKAASEAQQARQTADHASNVLRNLEATIADGETVPEEFVAKVRERAELLEKTAQAKEFVALSPEEQAERKGASDTDTQFDALRRAQEARAKAPAEEETLTR